MAELSMDFVERYVAKDKSNDWSKTSGTRDGLHSSWEKFYYPHEIAAQGRREGEIDDLVVYGEIPKQIEGTFYRLIVDPYMPPDPRNGFVEGDGNTCAIRIQDGNASLKMKYIETERYLLERKAGRPLFGIYRNPYTNGPSTLFANDSTANTNIIYWAGNVLALAERGLRWAIDPDMLETRRYDPFAGQVKAKTFTAHPKVDAKTNELVTWGQEARGLGTTDLVAYNITAEGQVKDVGWYNIPEIREEVLRAGGQHWLFDPERSQIVIMAPRRPSAPRHPDWQIDDNGLIQLEIPWTKFNVFYFLNPPDHTPAPPDGSYVRWTIDPNQSTNTNIKKMEEIFPAFAEFPVVDERFTMSHQFVTFLVGVNVLGDKMAAQFFNNLVIVNNIVKLDTKTGKSLVWDSGEGGRVSEPAFIPRSDDAAEGDGWLLVATARANAPREEIIILDTNDFSRPVAVVQMPFTMRDQLHGNWVPNPHPDRKLPCITKPLKFVQPTSVDPLNYI